MNYNSQGFRSLPFDAKLVKKVISLEIANSIEKTFAAFPDSYVTIYREKAIDAFDEYTNAVAQKEVTSTEFKQLGEVTRDALQDGKLQYQEIDKILSLIQIVAKN